MDWEEFKEEYGLSDEDAYRFYDGPIPRYHEEHLRKVIEKYWKWFKITLVITILWIIFGIAVLFGQGGKMLTGIIGFIIGDVLGAVAMAFMIGCHEGSKYDDGFSCAGCKNIDTPMGKSPCNSCRRDMPDCWEDRNANAD